MLTLEQIQQQVIESKQLRIIAGKTQIKNLAEKSQNKISLNYLNMSQYSGVIEYYPEELVITVKAGTTIKQLNEILLKNNQATSFTLSQNENSTIGGAYAMGHSDLRDAVLGIKIIDGQGRSLTFGGQVMKNVAGYDVARLLVGSKGKMAVICEISLKIIPQNYRKLASQSPTMKKENTSLVKIKYEQKIKNIFDPKGIFI